MSHYYCPKPKNERQSGFTLIELTMALAVGSLIMTAAAGTLFQVWNSNLRNTAHMMAIKQIENALHFLTRDVQMAQTVQTAGLPPGTVLRLSWVSWDGQNDEVDYTWSSANHTLTRTGSQDGVAQVVAYSVTSAPSFSFTDPTVTADLTCTVQGISEERLVQIARATGS